MKKNAKRMQKEVNAFIDKHPEFIYIIIGVIGFVIIGIINESLDTMFILFLGILVFGSLIGLISFLIKKIIK
ncbi:hypothetical protein [Flavobacterium sp. PL02]|jgi:hypothetical protein|uniref:hypothetical protein n=1 Tax=Flavobacterium sp. PL02 TaxID=3088354 RepID=UPI002B2291A5|nr:hypothetical protein [Flavobacterium sp. PL02]MEA9412261.1 hypothetical protein [Flavobacterium sp. PL02]